MSTTTAIARTSTFNTALSSFFKILFGKIPVFLATFVYIILITAFAGITNEIDSSGQGYGALVAISSLAIFILSFVILLATSKFLSDSNVRILKNMNTNMDPLDGIKEMYRYQFALICICTISIGTLLAGWYTGNPDDKYAKIINGKPLLAGEKVWVLPFFGITKVVPIEKKQTLKVVIPDAITADGVQVTARVSFEGVLSDEATLWFQFEDDKRYFTDALILACKEAIMSTPLSELDKPLRVSYIAVTNKVIPKKTAIVPSKTGVIEVYDFKVLAKQTH